ncbi:MAG TPA: ATP-binding cassette domain-containing protein [Paenalcaligenes sp.]|nr:ATP-binding cassette domain-containing protein [Paenalcaligenes sp.]
MSAILTTSGLTKGWGAVQAVRGVDVRFKTGCRHAIIGPNGAGKTTLLNLLAGALAPQQGQVFYRGQDITAWDQAQRVRQGVVRSFQQSRLFAGLTVLESVLLVMEHRQGPLAFWRALGHRSRWMDEAQALLAPLGLWAERHQYVRTLAYGQQRLLELAVVLATRPRVLLLDEPAAGVSAAESARMFEYLAGLPEDLSIILIEHDMQRVFEFAQVITVLVAGQVFLQASPAEVAEHPGVRRVYLGDEWGASSC